MIQLLLELGADALIVDNEGWLSMYLACFNTTDTQLAETYVAGLQLRELS